MKPSPDLKKLHRLIKQVAEILLSEVPSRLSDKKWRLKDRTWTSAYLDARWASDHSPRIAKLRVVRTSGRIFARAHIPSDAIQLINEIGELKVKAFVDKWYGLKLTVFPDGNYKADYVQDPNCALDPTFFLPDERQPERGPAADRPLT